MAAMKQLQALADKILTAALAAKFDEQSFNAFRKRLIVRAANKQSGNRRLRISRPGYIPFETYATSDG